MLQELEGTARYAGILLAPADGFGLQPRFFFLPMGKKKLFTLFVLLVVTLVTLKKEEKKCMNNHKH